MLKKQFQEFFSVVGDFRNLDQFQANARRTRETEQRVISAEGQVDELTRHIQELLERDVIA